MIIGIVGDIGSGKTLILTAFLYYDFLVDNKKIYANYGLKFKHITLDFSIIEKLFDENLNKEIDFAIDEMHIFMDSRTSAKKKNRILSYWILQTRKRNIDLFYSTQFFGQVDKRLRDATSFKIECNNLGSEKNPIFLFSLFKRINVDSLDDWIKIKDFTLKNCVNYYKLFDTFELINPFEELEGGV